VCPVTDCDFDRPSYRENAEGYFLTRSLMDWFWDMYCPPGERTDPRASPLRGQLSGLPPAFVVTCEFDPLRDEGIAYAQALDAAGLLKLERVIDSAQGAVVSLADGREMINLCANNYLGLSSHPRVLEAARLALDTHGYGLSSVRFICGTQSAHKTLETRLAAEHVWTSDQRDRFAMITVPKRVCR